MLANAFVNRVNRRIDMRILRFWRSTKDVLIMPDSGAAFDPFLASADALGAIAALERLPRGSIKLDQHGVINICAECAFHGSQIRLVAIGR
jgi:hypothetical protein